MVLNSIPAAGYKVNTFQEIKSHSSVLFNERMAILLYILDMQSIELNTNYDVNTMLHVRSVLRQIYKNIRTLIRNNPTMRSTLNLDTKDSGVYISDLVFGLIDSMISYCEKNGYTTGRVYIIVQKLNELEVIIKDILQYYHYFIRPDFKQKPDIEIATEKYKEIADNATIEELRKIVGKNNKIDFEGLGSSRVELQELDEENELEELTDDGPIHSPHDKLEKEDEDE